MPSPRDDALTYLAEARKLVEELRVLGVQNLVPLVHLRSFLELAEANVLQIAELKRPRRAKKATP